jgi:hypothetical protein
MYFYDQHLDHAVTIDRGMMPKSPHDPVYLTICYVCGEMAKSGTDVIKLFVLSDAPAR